MRLIFGLLVLLNLSFFYWQFSQPQVPAAPPAPLATQPAGVDSLVLLRERGLDVRKPVTVTGDEVVAVEALPAPGGDASVPPSEPPPSASESTVATPSVSPVPVTPEPASEPPPAPVAEPTPVVVLACYSAGPFADEASAGQMYKALLPLDIKIEQRVSERRVPKNYWVYLPPQKGYTEARRKVKALQKQGIDDMFIMGSGEMKNAISLGLFSRKSTATERLNEVRRLEPATVMKTQYRVIKKRWLDLTLDAAATDKLASIEALVADLPGVKLVAQKSCK